MPIYEYHCNDCAHEFEVLRKISEADAPIRCQNCQNSDVHRKISLFSANTNGKSIAGSSSGCSGCSGGNCHSCH